MNAKATDNDRATPPMSGALGASRWMDALLLSGCVWLGAAVASLGFGWALSGTVVHTLLPAAMRRELIALELSLLAIVVIPVSILGARLAVRLRSAGSGRRFARGLLSLAALLGLSVYAMSWATFRSTGRFLDSDGFAFMAMNPVPFLQHAAHLDPALIVALPAGIAAFVLAFVWGIPVGLSRLGSVGRACMFAVSLLSLGVCFTLSLKPWQPGFVGELEPGYAGDRFVDPDQAVIDPEAGMVYTWGELFSSSRDERSGPLSHAWFDLRSSLSPGVPLRSDPSIPVLRRPIVSMDEYVAGVDVSSLSRSDVLVVVIESLRPDQLRAFGGRRDVMSGVDAIAEQARRFSDHYSQASHSNYADMCLLSSHYPLRSSRVHVYPKNPSYPRVLIYDVLKALGWRTAVISSQNEVWGGMINYLRTGSLDHFFHSESFDGSTYVPRNDAGFEDFLKGSKRSGKIDDRFTIDEAIRWIGDLGEDERYFLYLNLQNSHLPYETPADFPRRFGPERAPFPITFAGFPRGGVPTAKNLYADSLAYIDFQLNRLVQFLRERGRWTHSVVVVTGDTGQAFYEHGFVAHASQVFNEVMRVPLLLRAPGVEAGRDPRPAEHIDIPPTILAALGLPEHPSFQGVNLLKPGPQSARSRFIMAQTPLAHQYAIVRQHHKLIYDARRDRSKLFDLAADPGERVDIANKMPGRVEELRVRLDTWRQHQLDYYRDPRQHSRTYPPVLRD